MIDWLNSFSFEEAARLVHPLVVLAVLAAINGAGCARGYQWSGRVLGNRRRT